MATIDGRDVQIWSSVRQAITSGEEQKKGGSVLSAAR